MKNELLESIKIVLIRDLNKLESELNQYPSEESLWIVSGMITNPAGNLCLHLCGNLQYYIGAVLGGTGYIRDRDNEFAAKNVARASLIEEITRARAAVEATIPHLSEQQLQSNYPVDVFGKPMTTLYFLIHLSAHLGYHLGQVNYHRRLLS